ncbi:PDZ domain-containing protein [Verrucomicrobiaceae bacterium 227]
MKLLAVLTLLLVQPVLADPGKSLVRINSTLQTYNAAQPWEKNPPRTRRGLGALLSDNRILTTAAMAADSIYIELQSADSTLTVPAKVTAIDYDANLALLTPDADPGFLATLQPAEFAEPVKAGDSLSFFQLEDNGQSLETQGTIRSMELLNTFVSSRYFLGYVAKASMQTSGNSFTLPAFHDGKLAGVLTSYDSKDQLCDVISIDIVSAFLEDTKDGSYEGFPSLGIGTTSTEDPHFRAWLKLPVDGGGLYVTRVLPGGSAEIAGLKKGDVITKVSGFEIDRRGYFQHPDYGVLYWPHLIRGAAKMGENMKITFLRDGEEQTIEANLKASPDPLIPPHAYDQAPPFIIKGGLVFQELSRTYLEAFGKDWAKRAPLNLLDVLSNPEDYEEGRRRLVILTRVVATEATIGYDRLNSQIVQSVNGKPIAGLPELAAALEAAPENGIHTIVTDEEPYQIFLDEAISDTVDADFLQRGLPSLSRLYEVTE